MERKEQRREDRNSLGCTSMLSAVFLFCLFLIWCELDPSFRWKQPNEFPQEAICSTEMSVDGKNLFPGGGLRPWAGPLITRPWVLSAKSSHIIMSTWLKCFQVEIWLSPSDQPDSGVGSKRIYPANLLPFSCTSLDFNAVFWFFFFVLLHIMAITSHH